MTAVEGVDLDIEPGTAVGLLGPNGAGKTTTIKSLLGLILPTDGNARVHGIDVHDNPKLSYQQIGAMLEGARNVYWRLTVRENMRFFAALAGHSPKEQQERREELLEQFGLTEKADTTVLELSRGQKQKVLLACTLARDASVIFLDEPTLGLDVESSLELRKELRNLVTDSGTTILLSSHDMDVIEEVCDRVVIMNDGRVIADDTVENLLGVFDAQLYEVEIDDPLDADVRETLRTKFDAKNFEERADHYRFEAQVVGNEFYSLVETLRSAGLSVQSFDSQEPNLEEVFLRITSEERQEASAIEAATVGHGENQ
ncbi:ABC transporter ATP-binding protein [Haladaptatus cibarius]|uniref:ABC transporter ATP-binding protein n=1 Tax=Haladaptatus cibarius TaxID=453847 RepID=UPI001E4DBFBC|nr:ABC transporter ATP-binding protein [Haladaptatus cibarius]